MGFRLQRRSLFAGALLAVACYSPTLPLPPPGKPEVSPIVGQPGYYRLMGRVEQNADVFARNRRTDMNSGQFTSSGLYDFVVQGEEGDQMELWYIVGSEVSPRVAFLLPPDGEGAGGAGGAP